MIKINIAEAKANLSRYLKRVEAGETIVLSRHSRPIAEIRPVTGPRSKRRSFGLCAGEFEVPDDFNAPLPEEVLSAFEGQ
jgi:prevent-host-death family protein